MVKKVVLAAVLFSVVFSSTCWAMLSFPEENELHCRGCHAPSGAPTADLHHQTNRAKTTGCLGCHPRNTDQTLKWTVRDCKACHVNPGTPDPFSGVTYTKGPHHRSLDNSECLLCHNVESILNQPQDPYAGAQDPAPAPIQPELTDETILFPITMSGVPQTTGVPDLLYGLFTPKDCGTCHIPSGDESTANLHHHSERSANSGCTYCHALDGVMQLPVQRNCLICHVQPGSVDPFTQETSRYSVHHRTAAATAENCTACHTDRIIDPPGTGLSAPYAPLSPPNLATPTTSSCRNCHAAIAYGSTTAKLHHAVSDNCTLCHSFGEEISGIRDCESCHTFESLHGINGHTSGTDRCIGCHGDYLANQPPVLEVSLLSREIYTEAPVMNIAGRAFSVTGISSLTINDQPITTDEAGYFSHPQALQPGLNTIIIKAVGNNGKEAIDTRKATLIGVQTEVTITSPADNSVVSTPEIPIEGTSATMSRIIVKHNKNKEARLIPWRGKFGTRIELQPGLNTIEISSMEKRQMVTRKRTVIYKPAQPALSVTWPAQDTVTRESTVNIEGNVPEGATITVTKDGVPVATLKAAGRFTVPLSLDEERAHRIEMMAVDVEGRTTKAARNVIFQRK